MQQLTPLSNYVLNVTIQQQWFSSQANGNGLNFYPGISDFPCPLPFHQITILIYHHH
jgi:hypothetical protein